MIENKMPNGPQNLPPQTKAGKGVGFLQAGRESVPVPQLLPTAAWLIETSSAVPESGAGRHTSTGRPYTKRSSCLGQETGRVAV